MQNDDIIKAIDGSKADLEEAIFLAINEDVGGFPLGTFCMRGGWPDDIG